MGRLLQVLVVVLPTLCVLLFIFRHEDHPASVPSANTWTNDNRDNPALPDDVARQIEHLMSISLPEERSAIAVKNTSSNLACGGCVQFEKATRYPNEFRLNGLLFGEENEEEISGKVTTSLIHSFTPDLEKTMKSKFVDPMDENFFYGLGPSIIWEDETLTVVARVWLARMKHKLKPIPKFPNNTFVINWLYKQSFNSKMEPLDGGSLLGIPAPVTKRATDGLMDPRIFRIRDRIYVIGQLATFIGGQFWRPHPMIWDLQEHIPILPMAPETDANRSVFREKNWIPLVIKNELHLFQNMDPIRLLKCDLVGSCEFAVNHGDVENELFQFDEYEMVFRGGTSFVEYQYPYFLSICHGVVHKNISGEDHRYYTTNLALLRVEPTIRFVYISDDLKFHPKIYDGYEDVAYFGQVPIGNDFVFPVSIVMENLDRVAIGAHVNDNISVLLRLRGIREILKYAIKKDQSAKNQNYSLKPYRVQNAVRGLLSSGLSM